MPYFKENKTESEKWINQIKKMLTQCMEEICEEDNKLKREELIKNYAALSVAEIAIGRLGNNKE